MINKKLIRVALYIRVSTEEQALHGLSLEAQDTALTEYAKKNGMVIVDRYVDEGITARKKINHRKALHRLLEDVKAGKIDLIIFTKIDRWMRNIYDYHKVQEILEKNNVNWKTIFESYDTSTATGRLHINIMLSVAQDEADRTSERIKAVFDNKIKNGEYTTNKIPFGYVVKDSKVFKDSEVQHVVDDMFEKFFETNSLYSVKKHIQDTYNIVLSPKSVSGIFKNTLYCGEYREVKDFCEPYITREQFDEIQDIRDRKHIKRPRTGRVYLFAGLLVCRECGCRLSGCSTRYKTGEGLQEARSYKCKGIERSTRCGNHTTISEKKIEAYLLKNVTSELDKYERELKIKAAEIKPARNTEKEIEKIKKKLTKLKDLYLNDVVDLDEYKKDYDDLNKQLSDLIAEPKEDAPPVDIEAIKNLLSKSTEDIYQTLTADDRRKFWNGFIDHIVVHSSDNMEIFFK